jgi:hypothetical protein
MIVWSDGVGGVSTVLNLILSCLAKNIPASVRRGRWAESCAERERGGESEVGVVTGREFLT